MRAIWVLLAAVVVALALATCDTGGEDTPTATETPSPSPGASATPAVIGGVPVEPLEVGESADFPEDVALIVETGCYGCDGPTSGLLRVYRDAAGSFHRDTLFTVEQLGLGPRVVTDASGAVTEEPPHVVNYVLSEDASRAVVSVCTRGVCSELGGEPSGDAQATLFRSLDGGAAWEQWGTLDGSAAPIAMQGEEVLLSRYEAGTSRFEVFPGGEAIEAPAGAGSGAWPLALPEGELLWPTNDGRLLYSDGSVFVEIGGDPTHEYQVTSLTPEPWSHTLLFGLYESNFEGEEFLERFYLFTTDGSGHVLRAFSVAFLPWLGAALGPGQFIGNADLAPERIPAGLRDLGGPAPVLIDVEAGVARPIVAPFSDPDFPKGRDFLVGVQR